MGASYFSLAHRVPEAGALEPKALAWFYGLVTRAPLARTIRRRFLAGALAQGVANGRGLDLGTGPGHAAVEIARYCPGMQMIGLDLAVHMVRQAGRNARRDRPVLWTQGDGHRLPFRDGSFDLVTSSFSLHHWNDPLSVLNEIARVLAPEGRYFITDLCREVTVLQRLFAYASIPAISLPLGSYRGYGGYYESVRAAYTRDEALHLLEQSALPGGEVAIDTTRFVSMLTISSGPTTDQPADHRGPETESPTGSGALTDSGCGRSTMRLDEKVRLGSS